MNIIKLSAIGSTNDYLKALSKETDLVDGTVVITEDQTQGKGQMGTQWYFEYGKSLAFSVFVRFREGIHLTHQFAITMQVSLVLAECMEQFGIPNISVKWPNDIMTGDKKLCGILVENQVQGKQVKASIIGIGLNVNNTILDQLPKASSMWLAGQNKWELEEVFETIAEEIIHQFQNPANDWYHLKTRYEECLYRKDRVSVFFSDGKQFNGIIRGVDASGKLEVELENETMASFQMKAIQLLN